MGGGGLVQLVAYGALSSWAPTVGSV